MVIKYSYENGPMYRWLFVRIDLLKMVISKAMLNNQRTVSKGVMTHLCDRFHIMSG